jgi:UV DNA damage endonuclease
MSENKNRIGYCCISIGCNENLKKKDHITVNRGMVKKTFQEKGLEYVSEIVIENLKDTLKLLDYNIKKKIFVYRLSSDSFPWMSEYKFQDLPKFNVIKSYLTLIGNKIKNNDIRVSYHPGPFNVLASENENVVKKTIYELNQHAELMDLMGLEKSHYYPINIHINTTKPTREMAASRFVENFKLLSDSCKSRLTLENDDSPNQYSVKILYDFVHKHTNIPIVFDQHHFNFGLQDQSLEEALKLALNTWTVKPLTHMSSSKHHEDTSGIKTAHANFIYEEIQTFGETFDIEIEAKSKDIAVLKYIKDFSHPI